MEAVCHHCGSEKPGALSPCASCGFTPAGADRALAWLFSTQHLDRVELARAAERIRAGDQPAPSRALQAEARQAMGARSLPNTARRPLEPRTLILLSAANLLLTSLVGYAVWFGMREERPVAARQALWLTMPVSLGMGTLWVLYAVSAIQAG